MTSHVDVERLRAVRSLPQLLAYLRDEMDWPIRHDAVEDDPTFILSLSTSWMKPESPK